jgi:ubiquinone/menaquinone biosynthesis C-methylase UbiE
MQQKEAPSPELFWRTLTAFQHTAALKAALDVSIFTAIAGGAGTTSEIATATGASERGVRIICDTMTVLGFLTKQGDRYEATESTALFLNRNSPAYLGTVTDFIFSPAQRRGFDDLSNAVIHGGSQVKGDASMDPDSPMWVQFAKAMVPMMMPTAQMIADQIGFDNDRELMVLDIAAGHGMFGITVAQKYPKAEIFALDWANVLTVATENAEKFGVAERHHLIPGSAFEADFGGEYDLILLTNFLHHFDAQTNTNLLKKIAQALRPDGKVITLEFIPNDDRISPPSEALFSLVMLAATPAGDAFTFPELRAMFENAGFSRNEHIPLPPMPQHLVVSTK